MQKSIKHFHYDFPLPENSTLRPYQHQPAPINKKKNKNKLTKFTYYKAGGGIIKVLFLDDDYFIDQGKYPFTDPEGKQQCILGKAHLFKDIGNVERMIVTEAVYIGHLSELQEGQTIKLVIKRINEAKISLESFEVETIDDNFQVIDVGNIERFNQFLKIQKCNPHAHQMSIRVIIDQEGKVIDFQFFEREAKLKKNKNYHIKEQEK